VPPFMMFGGTLHDAAYSTECFLFLDWATAKVV
jgi:hypothetical protein